VTNNSRRATLYNTIRNNAKRKMVFYVVLFHFVRSKAREDSYKRMSKRVPILRLIALGVNLMWFEKFGVNITVTSQSG
jgi:hypothetical protein